MLHLGISAKHILHIATLASFLLWTVSTLLTCLPVFAYPCCVHQRRRLLGSEDVTGHSHLYLYVQHYTDYFTMALLQQKKDQQRHFQPVWVFIDAHLFIFVAILHKIQHKHFYVCSLFPVFCSCKEHLHMVSAVLRYIYTMIHTLLLDTLALWGFFCETASYWLI